jgi:hypothetical protein
MKDRTAGLSNSPLFIKSNNTNVLVDNHRNTSIGKSSSLKGSDSRSGTGDAFFVVRESSCLTGSSSRSRIGAASFVVRGARRLRMGADTSQSRSKAMRSVRAMAGCSCFVE